MPIHGFNKPPMTPNRHDANTRRSFQSEGNHATEPSSAFTFSITFDGDRESVNEIFHQ